MSDRMSDEPGFEEEPGEEKEDGEEMVEENFEELLDAYGSGMDDSLSVGDKIEGTIISIGKDAVYIDTGTKIDGAVDKEELVDDNGELAYAEGDKVELYIVALSEHEIRLSKALSGIGGLEMLRDAFHGKVPVEGKVIATQKGGFQVEVLQRRAFCPVSQIDVKYVESPGEFVGQILEFLIVKLEDNGRNIVLSRRKLLEAEIAETRAQFFETLSAGQTLDGVVTKLMPFGAFIELAPGVEGMAHISELSWSRVEKPEEAVSAHQKLKVKVLGIENADTPDRAKISLSVKQIDGDPWESVEDRFQAGQKVDGKVVRIADFGAFVEIAPGIEGLVHISELSHTRRIPKVEDAVSLGETVQVSVKEIDSSRRRISLSIKDTEQDPWKTVAEKFPAGTKTQGMVVKKESFGYFIELMEGVTGLMPKSKIKAAGVPEIDNAKVGDTVPVTVLQVDRDARRITLVPCGEDADDNWREFKQAEEKPPMSDLAAKLQEALKKK